MAFVQAASLSTPVSSGTAASSLTGAVGGHGLVCFVLYNVAATSQTLSDSSGTKWHLWSSISLTGAQIAVFRTTTAVGAGTHTVTPSWTGGGTAWTSLVEDDQGAYWGSPQGQTLTAPGAGNTLVPGRVVGITGSSIYMLAVDTTNKTGTTFCPSIGAYDSNVWASNDTGIGSWSLAPSVSLGGTNSGMAPGPSDPTGADNYAVLAMAFAPSGNMVVDGPPQTVLVKEDVGPEQRSPYPMGMFFNRAPAFTAATPLAYLGTKTPPWEFYRDPFTSVYPVLELYEQPSKVQPAWPIAIFHRTRRYEPVEEETPRPNYSVFFQMQRFYTAQMVGYTTEQPDFNDHPWIEWVHPPANPETALFPLRRQPVITPPQPNVIYRGQPKPWWVDDEKDSVYRKPDVGVLLPYARPIPPTILMPNLIGMEEVDAIALILADGLLYQASIYKDVIYPILTPNIYPVLGPEPPPPAGIVIDQRPEPGVVVQPLQTEVVLIVSTGRSTIADVGVSSGNIPNTVIGSTQGP